MTLPRTHYPTQITDKLTILSGMLKNRSRAGLNDGSHILETISKRFFNALFGWELVNLNTEQANYPSADLADRSRRIAIQITNQEGADKITHTAAKAVEHRLEADFDRLIIFFLLQKKPGFPTKFVQPPNGPTIETWDVADLLKKLLDLDDLDALGRAAKVLEEEIGRIEEHSTGPGFDISRILRYAPAELIGRESEMNLRDDAWAKVQSGESGRPRVLTFVALGGEGKTSLVAKWAVEQAAQDWPGCEGAFAWSFYSQGSNDQAATSSDLFLKEALLFFGNDEDKEFAASNAGAYEKAKRLARTIGDRKHVLILDGLEPLQYPPASPTPGELKDQGIKALLRGLAQSSQALCVVTTRYSIDDLKAFRQITAPEMHLKCLSTEAGIHLLHMLGVRKESGSRADFETLVEDVKGHALTLTLLGGYLKRAYHGDIRNRDRVKFEKADERIDGGHAFRTMAAYENWLLSDGGDEGKRQVAVLRLMGLFDRPASADCIQALLAAPAISGLTEPLVGLAEEDWEFCLSGLEEAKLLTVNRDGSGTFISFDAHPHLREYLAKLLSEQNREAWQIAHRRLYEHLCSIAPECTKLDADMLMVRKLLGGPKGPEPTLEDLQPLYRAIFHGCKAGLEAEVRVNVYHYRIQRAKGYSIFVLGAHSSDLGALACFFDTPWRQVSLALTEGDQAWVLNETSLRLRFLGRLSDAIETSRAVLEIVARGDDWVNAAQASTNLSELNLLLGNIAGAVQDAEQAVAYADRSTRADTRAIMRPNQADVLHQAGRKADSIELFREAERIQAELIPNQPLLYFQRGFKYCDRLLATAERSAWEYFLSCHRYTSNMDEITLCREVNQRAAKTLEWFEQARVDVIGVCLDHLTLGRSSLYATILEDGDLETPRSEIENAVTGLRNTGRQDFFPCGLLTRAWFRFLAGDKTGPDSAQEDLDEAWEIAERGPMRLHMADIHLYRARLFFREAEYPWESPRADLEAAEALINRCGYHRRDEELADAKRAILGV